MLNTDPTQTFVKLECLLPVVLTDTCKQQELKYMQGSLTKEAD